jgi:hypothetical protein
MIYCVLSTTQNLRLQFIEFTFYQDCETTAAIQMKKLKHQTLVDILEDARWTVTLTILATSIWGGIHMNNVTNVFEQCYILVMPKHAWLEQIHLIANEYLALLTLNKHKL